MNTINGNFLERTIPNLKGALVTLNMGNSTSEMNLEDLATNLGAGVTSIIPGSGISVDQSTGNVTISATGGGGGTNPTSTYVPYNNGGTFDDSYLINDIALLKTNFEGGDKGIFLDFGNNIYGFGNSTYETSLSFTDNQFNLSNRLKIDFTNNNILYIGDVGLNYTGTAFAVDPANSIIETFDNSSSTGLKLDFINLQYKIGEFTQGKQTHLLIDENNYLISFYYDGTENGLKLDHSGRTYSLGQLNGGTGTKLEIDDQNQKLILSSNLETTSAGSGAAGKRLKITIGGTDYLIDLITP